MYNKVFQKTLNLVNKYVLQPLELLSPSIFHLTRFAFRNNFLGRLGQTVFTICVMVSIMN